MYKVMYDNNDYEVYEELIGLVKVPKTDAEILYTTLCDVCMWCILPLD